MNPDPRDGSMAGWLPIELARKDGTKILAWAPDSSAPGGYYGVAQWAPADGLGSVAGWFWPFACRPTHWQPLPSPPKVIDHDER